ncbi:hypothetical protein [Marinobacterium sp. BA1]|uniref:hypothetical protein n=1 Tax=Marinobacterium sp. BA1 TaxID=3138931 RepID=UPI0032E6E083
MQLINLMCQDAEQDEVYLVQFVSDVRDTVEQDIRCAVDDYMRADGANQVLDWENFTWYEVRTHIPDDYWESQGFTPVHCGISVTITDIRDVVVDENEDLAVDILPKLQAQVEAAAAETEAKAIRTPDDLVQRLLAAGYSEEQGQMVVGLMTGQTDPETVPGVLEWLQQCFNPEWVRRLHDTMLEQALNQALAMHGVEAVRSDRVTQKDDPDITFLEAGDTYNLTLVKYEGDWYCTSLGDVLESIAGHRAIPGKVALTEPDVDPLANAGADSQPSLG